MQPVPDKLPDKGGEGTRPEAPRRILDAAEKLILEQGVEGMSIRAVAQESGYSPPTIYHHFGDKTGLIDAALEARFGELLQVLRSVPRGEDGARYLRDVARAYVSFALENPNHYRLLTAPRRDEEKSPPSAEAARELVRGALSELEPEEVDVVLQVVWAVLHGLISLRINRPDYPFSDDLAEVAFDMMEHGLLRRRGAR